MVDLDTTPVSFVLEASHVGRGSIWCVYFFFLFEIQILAFLSHYSNSCVNASVILGDTNCNLSTGRPFSRTPTARLEIGPGERGLQVNKFKRVSGRGYHMTFHTAFLRFSQVIYIY